MQYSPALHDDNWLDFGTLAMGEQRHVWFHIRNENPVAIRLRNWGCRQAHCSVELMDIREGIPTDDEINPNDEPLSQNVS